MNNNTADPRSLDVIVGILGAIMTVALLGATISGVVAQHPLKITFFGAQAALWASITVTTFVFVARRRHS